MVGACFLWSTAGVVVRLLEHAESWEVAFWRSFFAALSMAGILAFTRRGEAWATVRAAGWPGIVSGAMFCTMFTCFMLAMTRTTVANALVVNSLYPVFAAILGGRPGTAIAGVHLGRHRRGGRRHGLDVRHGTRAGPLRHADRVRRSRSRRRSMS